MKIKQRMGITGGVNLLASTFIAFASPIILIFLVVAVLLMQCIPVQLLVKNK